ncbi:MAG: hypothetical protein ACI9U2_001609 [Bradymonadia bacterium]|jgi:hypothetical protein
MGAKHTALSTAKAIELARLHQPHLEDMGALFGLLFHQAEVTLDAQAIADAYAGVGAGKSLPRLGLSHHGVQLAIGFDAEGWACVRPPLQAVAEGDLAHVPRFVVESAQRILAVEQIKRLDEAPGSILLALLDPTQPPAPPEMLRAQMAEKSVTLTDLLHALTAAPLAHPFVMGTLDAFMRAV